ncbi:Vegetative incompatibility protein HET-E-1 [Rhizoctonia solani AG-1 IB]|uniref:Vegetative incompatibility protein HET-E-1 n=1 Tax=Thanatephorus cucumeris (strain AG1-IB / isolate 7/3/14) TaxID=1108050 RepID=M5C0D7_THACB|nr:Vegetative incompatibility protein HET-E-1 [Rhizoctonia solani AG-1 IB]
MPLPFLRDTLARSEARWKRWVNTTSKSGSTLTSAVGQGIWPTVGSLLKQLESGAEVFAPLKPAISGLSRLAEICESLSRESNEYIELRGKIGGVLQDLSEHIKGPTGSMMTGSVKLICSDIESEVNTLEQRQSRDTGRKVLDAIEGLEGVVDCCRRVHSHLERLKLNLNLQILKAINEQTLEIKLAKMALSGSAIYNSAESDSIKRGLCTPGTRKTQIDLLLEWARTPDAGKTCWMNGMAGTGKTTIAYTVCSELDQACQLGASFFCSRTIAECRQVKNIIPSIAYQLARFSVPFRCALAKALELDPDAHTRSLNIQYQKLIAEPLAGVESSLPLDFIVVIDALDECENEDSVSQILDLLLSTTHITPIRFLMSSRPEKEIARKMAGRLDGHDDARLVLHDLDSSMVKADIEIYMRHELKDIPMTDGQWSVIIERCGVLFIYASTTCCYIKQAYELMALEEVVDVIASSKPTHKDKNIIDELYKTVLDAAFVKSRLDDINKQRMRDVLETVVCAIEPMTVDAMAGLLGIGTGNQIERLMMPLRSVLNVTKNTGLVSTLHASFPDFMLSSDRSGSYHCHYRARHLRMTKACLDSIDANKPKFNVCGLASSYDMDSDVEGLEKRVDESISPALVYACCYWSKHFNLAESSSQLIDIVHGFFSSRLLLWMEVMNLTKQARLATSIIQDAERWCTEHKAPDELIALAHDASQFVSVYANHPVSQSTPHIYVSMLPLWPRSRPISTAYMGRTSGLVRPTGTAIDRRQLALIATWKVSTREVKSMSLTADGGQLVAPSENSIEVYDTTTGESVLSLTDERAKNVNYVAASPDGTNVVFSRDEGIAYVWDIKNGSTVTQLLPDDISGVLCITFSCDGSRVACGLKNGEVYICGLQQEASSVVRLIGHTDWVMSVVFSPDCLHLASGSDDNTVQVWDVRTGQPVGEPFEGHTDQVWSVSYSDDGSLLASASEDKTIRVWDPQTGQTVLGPLTGHSSTASSVSFSPGGAFIASGSWDHTIRVYDARTGHTVLRPLHGHNNWVNWVMHSTDGTQLYSCSSDGTVRIWNVKDRGTSDALPTTSGVSTGIYSARYSHSGRHVVSGSKDGTVHVWDVGTGELVRGPLRGHKRAVALVDYSPDDQYIASGSYDSTLRLWDATTGNDIHGPMRGHSLGVNCVRFSADGSALVSGSTDGTVRMWDVRTGQQTKQLLKGNTWILSVGMSSDGRHVVCGSSGGLIRVVDAHTGDTLVGPIQAHTGSVRSVDMWADGMRFVSGSSDRSVRIWDGLTGKQAAVCSDDDWSHSGFVRSVCVSPNGLYVASGSSDGTVCVWDGQNGKRILGPLRGHTGWVNGVQLSPDGLHVASCSNDGTIRFWDVSSIRTGAQEDEVSDAGPESTGRSSNAITLELWSLDEEGWVVDSRNRRLVWVPSDLRTNLALPPTTLVIAGQGHCRLGTEGLKMGDKWMGCYQA